MSRPRLPLSQHDVGSGENAHPWVDVLGELFGKNETVEIRVRHELSLAHRKLVARLGGVIVVDPAAAPPCAGRCGHSICEASK